MKLEEIEAEWAQDAKIDRDDLDRESLKIPELHHKYYKMFVRERVQYKRDEGEFAQYYKLKVEYYQGRSDQDTLNIQGWDPFQLILLKQDIPLYLEADKELIDRKLKLHIQKEKVDLLEHIIKTLNTRGFVIKNALDFMKFTNGGT